MDSEARNKSNCNARERVKQSCAFGRYSGVTPLFRYALPWKYASIELGCGVFSARLASAAISRASSALGSRANNHVLHIEKVGNRLVEALGPQMIAGFGIDQLCIDPEPATAAL